jgi:hypothetical protein
MMNVGAPELLVILLILATMVALVGGLVALVIWLAARKQ